jgi:signal transduction histidine kinase
LIDYRGEDVIVASVEDLTHELAVQDELQHRQEQLFQSEKLSALGEMLAGIAHELNNPLSIIVGNAEILHEELEETPHEKRIDKLARAAHRCVNIVRSFLSLARQEQLNLKPTQLAPLFDTAIDAIAPDAANTNVSIKGALPSDLPEVQIDDVQITQVLINLMTNALHAIRDAGRGDIIFYACVPDTKAGTVRLEISDNGPGVDPTIAHRIFDPLFTTKDVGKGTGVGLAFCHRIITAHKGHITLEKSNGDGAVFSITLPIAASD